MAKEVAPFDEPVQIGGQASIKFSLTIPDIKDSQIQKVCSIPADGKTEGRIFRI